MLHTQSQIASASETEVFVHLRPGNSTKVLRAYRLKTADDLTVGMAVFHLKAGDWIVWHSGRKDGGPEALSAKSFDRIYETNSARNLRLFPPAETKMEDRKTDAWGKANGYAP